MRISILSFFSGVVERGVEVYVDELSRRLSSYSDFDVDVITPHRDTLFKVGPLKINPYQGNENLLLRRLYLDSTSRQIYRLTRSILVTLAKNPPDLLYPVNNGWQSILSKWFCLRHKTKLILAGHSGPGWDDRVNLWLCPDVSIAFSQAQAQWARKVNNKVRIETISHSVDLSRFNPNIKSVHLKLERPIFVTVSALSSRGRGGLPATVLATAGETNKNIEATIKAVAKLKRGSLLLLGSGPDQNRIDKLASYMLPATRYQRLVVSHNTISQYYRAADVFTLASSKSEAFGIVYLEALASNLPVVTIDDPLRREIIGPAGVFVKSPQDSREYAQALEQAVATDWGNKPRSQAKKFSWDKSIERYNKLFKNLVNS